MIEKIKVKINDNKGKIIKFRYNGSRNQIEEFDGVITNTYNSIFTIKLEDKDITKSFTYSDVLIDNLTIFYEEK
ncbi:MAG: Veg family protein [Bacilli bacterium]